MLSLIPHVQSTISVLQTSNGGACLCDCSKSKVIQGSQALPSCCAGLQIFLEEDVDVAILEVGLGGRLDATNVVRAPFACGITPLGYDHMDVLGHTLAEISGEKAGILKEGSPAFTVPQPAEAMEVLQVCVCASLEPLNPIVVIMIKARIQNKAASFQLRCSHSHVRMPDACRFLTAICPPSSNICCEADGYEQVTHWTALIGQSAGMSQAAMQKSNWAPLCAGKGAQCGGSSDGGARPGAVRGWRRYHPGAGRGAPAR